MTKLVKKICSFFVYSILKVKKKDDEIFLIFDNVLGDMLFALSFLDALSEAHPGKRISVVGSRKFESIMLTYPQISRRILYPQSGLGYRMIRCMLSDVRSQEHGLEEGIYNTIPWKYLRMRHLDYYGIRKRLAREIYRIPEDGVITYAGHTPEKVSAIADFEHNKRMTAVINPYSKSAGFTEKLYEHFAKRLQAEGFIVYTNVVGDQMPIPGTRPLRCSIEQLYCIVRQIPIFVSVRSGIVDYLMSSGGNFFVVYEVTDELSEYVAENFRLDEWKLNASYEEVILRDGKNKVAKKRFEQFLSRVGRTGEPTQYAAEKHVCNK